MFIYVTFVWYPSIPELCVLRNVAKTVNVTAYFASRLFNFFKSLRFISPPSIGDRVWGTVEADTNIAY